MIIVLKKAYWLIIPFVIFSQSCGLYSFSGASIPPGMKTISVQFFENNAPLVVPNLSQLFTESLKDRLRNQSGLSMVRTDGDANFEGRITDYSIKPVAIEANNRAGLNRMTISVNVKYTNTLKPELGFEQSFSRYTDFPNPIQSQEQANIRKVNTMLTEDIFNRAFANW